MSTAEVTVETEIRGAAETIFDLIVDFGGQDRWLGRSMAFHGTSSISSDPIQLGTTYVEPGPLGVRNGEVTELERPTRISFHQPMTLRFGAGTIDIMLRCTLTPNDGSTQVRRVVTLQVPRHLRLFLPVLMRAFRSENERTVAALKAYVERQPS